MDARVHQRSIVALPFRMVDVAAQSKAHRLAERGRADGALNRPAHDDHTPSLAEHELITEVEAERSRCAADLSSQLRASRDALATLETTMEVATLRKVADDTLSKFQEESARLGREVLDLRSASRHATAEFEEFRTRNGLTRPTRQPSNRFLSFSILVAAVVAESGLNGVFFAEGSDAGLLGGVTLAFMISAVNVGLGSFTGFGPPCQQR